MAAGLAALNESAPVSAARAQRRSGSGVSRRKSRVRVSLALREAVSDSRSSRVAKARMRPAYNLRARSRQGEPSAPCGGPRQANTVGPAQTDGGDDAGTFDT